MQESLLEYTQEMKKKDKVRRVLKFSNNFSETSIRLIFISLACIGKPLH